jgi:hypothetical protein
MTLRVPLSTAPDFLLADASAAFERAPSGISGHGQSRDRLSIFVQVERLAVRAPVLLFRMRGPS